MHPWNCTWKVGGILTTCLCCTKYNLSIIFCTHVFNCSVLLLSKTEVTYKLGNWNIHTKALSKTNVMTFSYISLLESCTGFQAVIRKDLSSILRKLHGVLFGLAYVQAARWINSCDRKAQQGPGLPQPWSFLGQHHTLGFNDVGLLGIWGDGTGRACSCPVEKWLLRYFHQQGHCIC